MDKESLIELQKIDCNCNNCIYFTRDFQKFEKSVELHRKWQTNDFNNLRESLIRKSDEHIKNGNLKSSEQILKQVSKMKFQFDKSECRINFGKCEKFKKEVSFLPNILMLETQNCFKHRSSL